MMETPPKKSTKRTALEHKRALYLIVRLLENTSKITILRFYTFIGILVLVIFVCIRSKLML